jgi:hypothetical protein
MGDLFFRLNKARGSGVRLECQILTERVESCGVVCVPLRRVAGNGVWEASFHPLNAPSALYELLLTCSRLAQLFPCHNYQDRFHHWPSIGGDVTAET